jgi:SAM-dependent methyltransferase
VADQGSEHPIDDAPSEWVVRQACHLPRQGPILDLACGSGRHARWLAARGWSVLAVDCDATALRALADTTGVETRQLDLENGKWPLVGEQFAGIVVTRYLHRPRLPELVETLQPGGVLIYETFMQGQAAYGRPTRPEFLLAPGELTRLADQYRLSVIDFQEGFVATPRPMMLQAVCCRKPG